MRVNSDKFFKMVQKDHTPRKNARTALAWDGVI
jgi:hypothetical protein